MAKNNKKKSYRTNLADIYSRPSVSDRTIYKIVSDIEKAKRYVKSKLRRSGGKKNGNGKSTGATAREVYERALSKEERKKFGI